MSWPASVSVQQVFLSTGENSQLEEICYKEKNSQNLNSFTLNGELVGSLDPKHEALDLLLTLGQTQLQVETRKCK